MKLPARERYQSQEQSINGQSPISNLTALTHKDEVTSYSYVRVFTHVQHRSAIHYRCWLKWRSALTCARNVVHSSEAGPANGGCSIALDVMDVVTVVECGPHGHEHSSKRRRRLVLYSTRCGIDCPREGLEINAGRSCGIRGMCLYTNQLL